MSARTPEIVLFQKAKELNKKLRSVSYQNSVLTTDIAKELLHLNTPKSEYQEDQHLSDPFTNVRKYLTSYQMELAKQQDKEGFKKAKELSIAVNQYEMLFHLANPDWKIGVNQGLFTSFVHALNGIDSTRK